jgi:hypothetical protein
MEKIMQEETIKLLNAVETVNKAVNKILDSEPDPQEGAALSGSMELVKLAVSGYTLFSELANKELKSG